MTNIAVIGAGYVGITTAACFAHLGHQVVCADINPDRVEMLRKGEVPILERHLPVLVAEGLESGRLRFELGAAAAVSEADFVFLCVATPSDERGAANLSYLDAAAGEIAPILAPRAVVITKSTVPVGTARRVERLLEEHGAAPDVRVASNPEFLREGHSVDDFLSPDRIVVGCDDPQTAHAITLLYRNLHAPVVVTDPASAEMIKYAANAYLASRVSFVNALANLCEALGADIRDVTLGMGYDHRIGSSFLQPGPGYGGSCLPKDTAAIIHAARTVGYELLPVEAAVEVNRRQHQVMLDKIVRVAGGSVDGLRVAAWGLTFKAGTDDLRDSPAIAICRALVEQGAAVHAYDPAAGHRAAEQVSGITVTADPFAACEGADVLVVLTEWDAFKWLDFNRVAATMAHRRIVDARNILDPRLLRHIGFHYEGVGR